MFAHGYLVAFFMIAVHGLPDNVQAAPSGTLKDNLLLLNIRRDSDGVATDVS